MNELTTWKVLIVEDHTVNSSNVMRTAINTLCDKLKERSCRSVKVADSTEAMPLVSTDMDIDAILVATELQSGTILRDDTMKLYNTIRVWQHDVPLFLLADRENDAGELPTRLLDSSTEVIWIMEDSADFISGRVFAAIAKFRAKLLPPLMKAIWEYNESNHEYSWAAPGHQGGRGFTKTPAGKKFYDFYGEF